MTQKIETQKGKSSFFKTDYFHYCVALILMVAIKLLLVPENGLTEAGVTLVAVVCGMLYLLVTANSPYIAFLLAPLVIVTGVNTGNAVSVNFLATTSIMLVLVFSIVCTNLGSHGVVDNIATWFITRPIAQGKPYVFLTMFTLSQLFIGTFMENLTVSVLYISLTEAICEKIGAKKGDSLHFALMMNTVWAGGIISVHSPIAKICPNQMLTFVKNQLGLEISYTQWLAVGIPFAIISMFAILLVTRFVIRPDMTPLKNIDVKVFADEKAVMSKPAKISVITMAVLVAFIVLPETFLSMGINLPVIQYLKSIPIVVYAMFSICVLCNIKYDGKPVMDFKSCLVKVPLSLMFFQGTLNLISPRLGADDTGVVTWLKNLFTPFIADLPVFGVFVALLVFTVALTQVLTNVVSFTLVFNIGIAMLSGTGFNMAALAVMITIMAGLAFMLPPSSVGMPLWFGPGHVTVGKAAFPTLCITVLMVIVVIALIPWAQVVLPI